MKTLDMLPGSWEEEFEGDSSDGLCQDVRAANMLRRRLCPRRRNVIPQGNIITTRDMPMAVLFQMSLPNTQSMKAVVQREARSPAEPPMSIQARSIHASCSFSMVIRAIQHRIQKMRRRG